MKPTYESSYIMQDKINEEIVASLISKKWKCDMVRQGHYDSFDYIAMRGDNIVAFIELRSRSHDYGEFKDCFISLTKLLRANELKQTTGLPCFFVVSWLDRSGWVNLDQIFKLKRSGKKWSRRNNPEISELLGSIPIDKFKMFN